MGSDQFPLSIFEHFFNADLAKPAGPDGRLCPLLSFVSGAEILKVGLGPIGKNAHGAKWCVHVVRQHRFLRSATIAVDFGRQITTIPAW